MKLQKAPRSKPQHPKKLQNPKFKIRAAFWNFKDWDFLGTWDLELFKTPLLHFLSECQKAAGGIIPRRLSLWNFRYAIPSDCSVG
jgi:hypothetical protein